ncbi:hypothetical protein EGI97_21855 [Stutzerimonas xanthomarina]|nr:hypothetical protein EGI97_21855 [Stutzerimonas xanthomarina]
MPNSLVIKGHRFSSQNEAERFFYAMRDNSAVVTTYTRRRSPSPMTRHSSAKAFGTSNQCDVRFFSPGRPSFSIYL